MTWVKDTPKVAFTALLLKRKRRMTKLKTLLVLSAATTILAACGGGGSSSPAPTPTPPPTPPPAGATVTITGKATFDSVPHNTVTNGLNYSATTQKPIRGATVELLNSSGGVLSSSVTNSTGDYSFSVDSGTSVRVRVRAEMKQNSGAVWDVAVTDNTDGNAVYAVQGSLASSGTANSVRNLNAASGWGGSGYTATRAAAPFAIMSPIYDAMQKFVAIDSDIVFPPVEFRWSTLNRAESGDLTTGQIGTSSYQRAAGSTQGNVFILGDANNDTDEYDTHVVVHEWGHYFEDQLSRSDSVGGSHSSAQKLDPRVAFGEGFGNALSGMILDDPFYRDSGGTQQSSGFSINVERNTNTNAGWFNEGSIQSFLYDLYDSTDDGVDTVTLGLGPIYEALVATDYTTTPVFTTIFSFVNQLKTQSGLSASDIDALLTAQTINGTGPKGVGETNSGAISNALPVYRTVLTDGVPIEVCSRNDAGAYNKLGNRNFVTFNVATTGSHILNMTRTSGATGRDPDFNTFIRGGLVDRADSGVVDAETATLNLVAGDYVVDAYDFNNINSNDTSLSGDACFNFSVTN